MSATVVPTRLDSSHLYNVSDAETHPTRNPVVVSSALRQRNDKGGIGKKVREVGHAVGGWFRNIWVSFKQSGKLQFLLALIVLLVIMNSFLIYHDHMKVDNGVDPQHNVSDSFANSVYLTTTQISTVGYGDVCAKTTLAKYLTSAAHMCILFLGLGLAMEFGANTVINRIVEDSVRQANLRTLDIVAPTLTVDITDALNRTHRSSTSLPAVIREEKKKDHLTDIMLTTVKPQMHALKIKADKEIARRAQDSEQRSRST